MSAFAHFRDPGRQAGAGGVRRRDPGTLVQGRLQVNNPFRCEHFFFF